MPAGWLVVQNVGTDMSLFCRLSRILLRQPTRYPTRPRSVARAAVEAALVAVVTWFGLSIVTFDMQREFRETGHLMAGLQLCTMYLFLRLTNGPAPRP